MNDMNAWVGIAGLAVTLLAAWITMATRTAARAAKVDADLSALHILHDNNAAEIKAVEARTLAYISSVEVRSNALIAASETRVGAALATLMTMVQRIEDRLERDGGHKA